MLHVIFTPEGIPAHISADPRPGSEPLDGLDIEFLATHRRTVEGEWVRRDPPPPPTPEEIAAQEAAQKQEEAEAEQLRQAEREAVINREIVRRTEYDALLRSMGKITVAELNRRVAAAHSAIEAEFGLGE